MHMSSVLLPNLSKDAIITRICQDGTAAFIGWHSFSTEVSAASKLHDHSRITVTPEPIKFFTKSSVCSGKLT